ncbi:MAG: NADH-quinone oxidoreductase subunit L [Acidobacteria bacterium]|nr:MAG: NADH-quinone oxidoreductase subunit L [Acidobacteriota bacterium]
MDLLWLIPVLPLIGAAVNGFVGKRLPKNVVAVAAAGSVGISFLISLGLFIAMLRRPATDLPILKDYFTWIQAGAFQAQFGLMLDHLSGLMILIVTGIGFLIHVYSIGYMSHEEGFYRYFAYLNLFVFFMLTLVLANNYLLMFVGWEGVGLCSYLLIGFWFSRKAAADAGKKAFIVNRIGDFGFILAVMLIYWTFDRVDFSSVFSRLQNATLFPVEPLGSVGVLTTICLLLFVGAAGKSAQFPLYVWLPDAMEGPTPVSALIHAATMVTAGVYMVARSASLYNHAPGALLVVAVVGLFTAIYAASIGLVQTDIKKVLAYSTVSQLGYMFLACGAGTYAAGIFHLMTHAFFKALLFLGAGSVIHGMGGVQDIRKMGGLRQHMPWTHATFLAGTIAIAGIPPFSGFFSKDAVLWGAWNDADYGKLFWLIGVAAAGLTSFYMFRLLILTFYGKPRYSNEDVHHVHEAPGSMLFPLVVLAIGSIFAGWLGVPQVLGGSNPIQQFLTPGAHQTGSESLGTGTTEFLLMLASTSVALLGSALAYLFYIARPELPEKLASRAHAMYSIMVNKYYVDELYDTIIVWPLVETSRELLWKFVDTFMIDGAVNNIGRVIRGSARGLRHMQNGYVRAYAGWILFGGVLVMAWFLR